jgi:uncharacterized alkaline shock family protein YloU
MKERAKLMSDTTRPPGKTTVATGVLLTIARLTTLQVRGVSRMYQNPVTVNRIFQKGDYGDGINIYIEDDAVYADIHVIVKHDVNIREVSRKIQQDIKRAFSEMVGMDVGAINIYVENIDYPAMQAAQEQLPA